MILNILRAFTKHYPFQQPRASLLRRLPDVPSNFGEFEAKYGIKYASYSYGQDYIVKNLFWFGDFEPWITVVIGCLIQHGDVFCDIGANIGDTSLQVIPFVGSSGHIYCFEPVPRLQVCLRENLNANRISCATLIPKALSNFSGKLTMTVDLIQPGWSHINKNNEDTNLSTLPEIKEPTHENIKVDTTTFDAWLEESDISQVALCKIDVEGHELEVLEGMKEALNKRKIGSIVFERHKHCNATDPVIQLLHTYDYRLFRIYKSFLKTKVVDLFSKSNNLRVTPDYVAVLKNSVFEERLNYLMKT
ncbi:FkbM family methyltransferase [Sphaerospermopsis sp. LEGE 08334]|uniref:FkbM family methyltransferase n=1 Tax=Sphaerospermopsis sp. LEGE 08334 TaxID=1828651 RepID=UPI0018802342|nr:FkbM family methyltransferase [Sphaerospermopsis sp. LEGE 08334]MBE9055489.1 FkbM family methyltransferase [Sphaerospermopsis sp. LEGE 08334]